MIQETFIKIIYIIQYMKTILNIRLKFSTIRFYFHFTIKVKY